MKNNHITLNLPSANQLLDQLRDHLAPAELRRLQILVAGMTADGLISVQKTLDDAFHSVAPASRQAQLRSFLADVKKALASAGLTNVTLVCDRAGSLPDDQRTISFRGPSAVLGLLERFSRAAASIAATQPDVPSSASPAAKTPICGFISYSHLDNELVNELRGLLAPHLNACRPYQFITWQDNQLRSGEKWDEKIGSALAQCNFGFFMFSASFCASDYIIKKELQHFRETGKPFVLIGVNKCDITCIESHGLVDHQIFRLEQSWFSELRELADKREFALRLFQDIIARLAETPPPPCPGGSPPSTQSKPARSVLSMQEAASSDPRSSVEKIAHHLHEANLPGKDTHIVNSTARETRLKTSRVRFTASDDGNPELGAEMDAQTLITKWVTDPFSAPYFVLLGEVGVGKTTTLRKLTRHLIEARKTDATIPLPIYIDLREFQGRRGPGIAITVHQILQDAIDRNLQSSVPAGFSPQQVIDAVQNDRAFIIFDGLDEKIVHLSEDLGRELVRSLWQALPPALLAEDQRARDKGRRDLPARGKILISCRSHYFKTLTYQSEIFTGKDQDAIGDQSYAAAIVLPFNEAQIRIYLAGTVAPERVDAAMELIHSVHNLRDLAERPMLLKTIADNLADLEDARASGQPVLAASLYDIMVEKWLIRDDVKSEIRPEDKPILMEALAHALWLSGDKTWTWERLHLWFDKFLGENADFVKKYFHPISDAPEQAATMRIRREQMLKNDLRTATFIVRQDTKPAGYRFAHTSFQEYWLARALYRALVDGRREAWAMLEPSMETFDFLGDLLVLREDSAQALKGLAALLEKNTWRATRNAFRYWVRAMEKDAPMPQPTRVALAGENLREWNIVGKTPALAERPSERGFRSPASPGGAANADASKRVVETRSAEGTASGVDGATNAPLRYCIPALDLTGVDLTGSCWEKIAMPGVKFTRARAEGALLRHCDVTGATWDGADFSACDLVHPIGLPNPLPANLNAAWCVPGNAAALQNKPRTLQGVGSPPLQLGCAWSPDGSAVLSASSDNTLRVWDASSGNVRHLLFGHTGSVWGCAWSPDGSVVLSASADQTLRMWDASNGKVRHVLSGHTHGVYGCAWSPDGGAVLSASGDHTLRVWDASNGEVRLVLSGHTGRALGCAWSPNSCNVLSSSADGTLRVWDASSGKVRLVLSGHTGRVFGCAWSPDGSAVLSASDDQTLRVWDASSGKVRHILSGHTGWVRGCAWSRDGSAVLSASDDDTLRLWDARSGKVRHVLSGHTGDVIGCGWSPDGSAVVSASERGTLRLWDVATQRPTLALLAPSRGPGAAVDLTRNVLITDAGDAWRNWRWEVEGVRRTLPLEAFTAP